MFLPFQITVALWKRRPVAASTAAPKMPPKPEQMGTERPKVKGASSRPGMAQLFQQIKRHGLAVASQPAMSPRNAPDRSPRNAPNEAKQGPVTPVRIKGAATCHTKQIVEVITGRDMGVLYRSIMRLWLFVVAGNWPDNCCWHYQVCRIW